MKDTENTFYRLPFFCLSSVFFTITNEVSFIYIIYKRAFKESQTYLRVRQEMMFFWHAMMTMVCLLHKLENVLDQDIGFRSFFWKNKNVLCLPSEFSLQTMFSSAFRRANRIQR